MTTDTTRTLVLALDRLRAQGVSAEVLIEETALRSVHGRRDAVRGPQASRLAHARVTVEGGRSAALSAPAANDGVLQGLLERALALARDAAPDPLAGPAEKMDIAAQGLQIADLRQPRLSDDDRREVVSQNEDALRSVLRNGSSASFAYEERVSRRVFATTRGASGQESGTRFSLRGSLRFATAGGAPLEASALVESRRFADVASVPLGADLLKRVTAMSPALSRPSRALPLVFEPPALAMLLPRVVASFDGARVAAGKSWICAMNPEESPCIASTRLFLVDDAAQPGALETRAFDDRGVPPMPVPLVREGRLGALYLDTCDARRRDMRPTGHYKADGSLWTGNLMIRPGARSRNMMFPDVGPYLLVADIFDLGGVDVATGAFVLPVRLCMGEQGQVKGTVGNATLRGTIQGFLSSIVEMASDTERHSAVDACTWVTEGLEIQWV